MKNNNNKNQGGSQGKGSRRAARKPGMSRRGLPRTGNTRDKKWFAGWENGSIPTPFGVIQPGKLMAGSGDSRRSRDAMVGLSERSNDIQVVMPRLRTESGGPYGTMDILGGTEFLQSITNPEDGALPGDILATIAINPSLFDNTRLQQFSNLYQRYRFRKLVFWYKPTANATQSGQLIGFGDYDPDNILSVDSPNNLSTAAAHLGQRICKIWETVGFPFGIVDDYTSLFVDTLSSDLRLSVQGVYYLLAAAELLASVSALGNIYIEYEIEFYIPILAPTDAGSDTDTFTYLSIACDDSTNSPDYPLGVTPSSSFQTDFPQPTLSFGGVSSGKDVTYDSDTGALYVNTANLGDIWLFSQSAAFFTNSTTGNTLYGNLTSPSSASLLPMNPNVTVGQNSQPTQIAIIGVGLPDEFGILSDTWLCEPQTSGPMVLIPGWLPFNFHINGDSAAPECWVYLTRLRSGAALLRHSLPPTSKLALAIKRLRVRQEELTSRRIEKRAELMLHKEPNNLNREKLLSLKKELEQLKALEIQEKSVEAKKLKKREVREKSHPTLSDNWTHLTAEYSTSTPQTQKTTSSNTDTTPSTTIRMVFANDAWVTPTEGQGRIYSMPTSCQSS
jgi:hypothetical protein